MALEPLYVVTLMALATLSTAWVIAAFVWRWKGWAWRLISALGAWWLVYAENAVPQMMELARSDIPLHAKVIYVCTAVLITLDAYVIYTFAIRKGVTTRGMRLFMMVLFALSHGGIIWELHSLSGTVCAPFTVYFEICTQYGSLGTKFILVPVVGYVLMALVTNEENIYSVLSVLGHRVGVSSEGVDADPEPIMSIAMLLETLGLKTLFERVRPAEKKDYHVQAQGLQKSLDNIFMLLDLGGDFEIADFKQLDEVGEAFALAAASDDLTTLARQYVSGRNADRVLELQLSHNFADSFNTHHDPVKRYGLRMKRVNPIRADYYTEATRNFFEEMHTLLARTGHMADFMKEAEAAYNRLPYSARKQFNFRDYAAMFMTMSGKGAVFAQYGLRPN